MTLAQIDNSALPATGVTSAAAHAAIDELERVILGSSLAVQLPEPKHTFTHGLYSRELYMVAGLVLTSKIHMTQHQWACLQGKAEVWVDGTGWVLVQAGDTGITQPGTRRVLKILEDCRWVTYHPNPNNHLDPDLIEREIILKHDEHVRDLVHPQVECEAPQRSFQ